MKFGEVVKSRSYLVLVLRAVGAVLLQTGEQTTLRARLGAGVQLTQLHKIMVLCHVFLGQVGNHDPLLQVAAALIDRTADVRFRKSHLGDSRLEVRKIKLQLQLRTSTWFFFLFPFNLFHNITSIFLSTFSENQSKLRSVCSDFIYCSQMVGIIRQLKVLNS